VPVGLDAESAARLELTEMPSRAWARQAGGVQVDVAIVGAGGAGLNLVAALDRQLNRLDGARSGPRPTVALLDPVHRRAEDRTWCFWDEGTSPIEAAVHRSWDQIAIVGPDGRQRRHRLGSLRYVMVRSADFYALADDAAARIGAVRVPVTVDDITDGDDHATIRAGSEQIRARWVFDSRPARPVRPGRTMLLQHFRGWRVRFHHAALEPDLPVLMDFSVPQPERGTAFCYVLPSDRRTGLVEYTLFSRERLEPAAYDEALATYLVERWGTGGVPGTYRVEEVEDGVIPMTDAVFARHAGRRVFRIGTAGGATRPATGYTFATMLRQAEAMAQALLAGRRPVPPAPHSRRHRWLDAVMLRALDQGHLEGAELFTRLFDRNPAERVLRFLDGVNSPVGDLAMITTAPIRPMLRAAAGDLSARVRRR
jgi:lycopene beta-cyclase